MKENRKVLKRVEFNKGSEMIELGLSSHGVRTVCRCVGLPRLVHPLACWV